MGYGNLIMIATYNPIAGAVSELCRGSVPGSSMVRVGHVCLARACDSDSVR